MLPILTDEANERLQVLYRVKLAEAELVLAEIQASPIPDDNSLKNRRSRAITRWSSRVTELRRQIADQAPDVSGEG